MRPYIDVMRENIAQALCCDVSRVNVKATRGEKMGPVGHGECVVAGVGLNVNQREFPGEIAGRATSLAAPLAVDGDVTVTGARVEFLNFTNIVTDTWHDFLTATGTATGDFASDNLSGPYRRKKADSTFSLAHLTGMLIIFR